jgi:hypothetical protein
MKVEIVATSDENFKIELNSNPNSVISPIEEISKVPVTVQEPIPVPHQYQIPQETVPKGAPIENAKGLSWFSGTSWGN